MPYDSTEDREKPDLSYLSAQPPLSSTSTAGMPVALAAVASRNLAVEDAGNARVNAASRNLITPSIPQTEAGNLSMANAMERSDRGNRYGFNSSQYLQNTDKPEVAPQVDPVIGELRSRQQQLLSGIDPDKPAIYPNRLRQAEMRQELYHVTGALHQQTLDAAHQAHENYRQTRDIQSAEEFTGLVNGLADMKSKPGTPEHAQELLGLVQQYPIGSQSKAALALLKTHAATHAEHKTLQESIADYKAATGMDPDSIETTATGGFNLRGKTKEATGATDKIKSATLDRYAKLQGEIAQHETGSEAEAKANAKANMPDTPYSGSAKWAAAQKELAILEQAHPALKSAAPEAKAPADERVSVISPDGKEGHIPKSQLDEALKAGYKAK